MFWPAGGEETELGSQGSPSSAEAASAAAPRWSELDGAGGAFLSVDNKLSLSLLETLLLWLSDNLSRPSMAEEMGFCGDRKLVGSEEVYCLTYGCRYGCLRISDA